MAGTAGPPAAAAYPLSMRLQDRLAVVVGGGRAAAERIAGLCSAGAEILVVAPDLSPPVAELASRGRVRVRRRSYLATDLDGAWLVLACTSQAQVNAAVAADAERRRVWCIGADVAAAAAAACSGGGASVARRVLILGGARSGKSASAEAMLAGEAAVDYVATGPLPGVGDGEWDARVGDHRSRRPAHWRTQETLDLERVLAAPDTAGPVLIDCLSTWLARVMDDCRIWAGRPGADEELAVRVDGLVHTWQAARRPVVAVSNEVGSGVVPGTVSGRRFRDELGRLNARLAAGSHEVWLCTAGIAQRLR